jgi:hypothetical protein
MAAASMVSQVELLDSSADLSTNLFYCPCCEASLREMVRCLLAQKSLDADFQKLNYRFPNPLRS